MRWENRFSPGFPPRTRGGGDEGPRAPPPVEAELPERALYCRGSPSTWSKVCQVTHPTHISIGSREVYGLNPHPTEASSKPAGEQSRMEAEAGTRWAPRQAGWGRAVPCPAALGARPDALLRGGKAGSTDPTGIAPPGIGLAPLRAKMTAPGDEREKYPPGRAFHTPSPEPKLPAGETKERPGEAWRWLPVRVPLPGGAAAFLYTSPPWEPAPRRGAGAEPRGPAGPGPLPERRLGAALPTPPHKSYL